MRQQSTPAALTWLNEPPQNGLLLPSPRTQPATAPAAGSRCAPADDVLLGWAGLGSFVLAFHMRNAVWVYVYVESHRVAADRAVFDVVLVRAPGDIHWHDDLFAAGVTEKGSFEMNGWISAAAFGAFLGHGTQKCSPSPCAGWHKARCLFRGRLGYRCRICRSTALQRL